MEDIKSDDHFTWLSEEIPSSSARDLDDIRRMTRTLNTVPAPEEPAASPAGAGVRKRRPTGEEDMAYITFRAPRSLQRELKIRAVLEDLTMQEMLERAVRQYLDTK